MVNINVKSRSGNTLIKAGVTLQAIVEAVYFMAEAAFSRLLV